MIKNTYSGLERRKFVRLDHVAPLNYKICKEQTLTNLLQGYTINISETGLLCNIKDKVKKNDILWFTFDRGFLSFCEELEKRTFIYQNGIIAKVARIEPKPDGNYEIGVNFIVREEINLTNIYPKIQFPDRLVNDQLQSQTEEEPQNFKAEENSNLGES